MPARLPQWAPASVSRVTVRELDRDVAGCAGAHQRLLAGLDGLDDATVQQPSRLPGWTVGHVLTHLARNADSFTRLFAAAARGEVADQYPGGAAQREADIAAGAARSAAELVRDVRASVYALEGAWSVADAGTWGGQGRTAVGAVPITELPFRRWRETEVHHVDLGLGYAPADWPADYVRLELARMEMLWASRRPMGLTTLPAEALAAPAPLRLAWLLGRAELPGVGPAGIF